MFRQSHKMSFICIYCISQVASITFFGYAVVRDGFVVCAVAGHFVGRMSSSGAYDFLGGACKIRGSFLSNLDNQHLQW